VRGGQCHGGGNLDPSQPPRACSHACLSRVFLLLLCKEECIKTAKRERKGGEEKKKRIYVSLAVAF